MKRRPDDSGSSEDAGAELVLASAHDAEPLVCARGSLFLVTERHGDITPAGARELGLFQQDTRHLSFLQMRVVDRDLVYLSSQTAHDAFNQVDSMLSGLEQGEFLEDHQNFLHVQRRQLLDGRFVEQVKFASFLTKPIEFQVEIAFAADFADIFEVRGAKRPRRGQMLPARVAADRVRLSYRGLDGVEYATDIVFWPAPLELSAGYARFKVELQPGGSGQIEYAAAPCRDRAEAPSMRPEYARRAERLVSEMREFRAESLRVRTDNSVVEGALEQSVADLYSLRLRVGPASVVAAGIPWFCAAFGRDSLIASYAALLLNPELAAQSLRVLAAFQGRRDDAETEEEPGKIFHELRSGEMAQAGEIPHAPYYGTIDATPLFLVVTFATYAVTGDRELLRELRASLLAALAYLDSHTAEATRPLTYQRRSQRGLDNQGWKDSRAGVSFPDGRRAEPPIALCEVQGYCADAYHSGSQIFRALGEFDLAELYAARSQRFWELVQREFWLPEQQRFAFAIDGSGRKLDTVVSNLGHLLWSRVATPEQALSTTRLLLSPQCYSGYGIRTVGTQQAVYNPLSYHNGTVWPHDNALIAKGMACYGHTPEAALVFEGLIGALEHFRDRRLPELFCGMQRDEGVVRYPVACSPQAWASAAPFLLLEAALGISIDAPRRRLLIANPCLPASMHWVELSGLRIGESRVQMTLQREGKRVHVARLDVTGPSIRTDVQLS